MKQLNTMMNDIGGINSSNSSNGNGGSNSDSSLSSGQDSKLCRDFIRNVCHRGKNCKFIHPENIKIRSDPIFCHDFQQNRCHRPTCKFIHCSREVEEHYKKTGELPDTVYENENNGHHNNHNVSDNRGSGRSVERNTRGSNGLSRASNGNIGNGLDNSLDVPVCKDYLKGVCNRPFGACKYRHINSQSDLTRNGNGRSGRSQVGNGKNGTVNSVMRRRGSDGLYDLAPDTKKLRSNENSGFSFGGREEFNEDFYVGNNRVHGYTVLPPPPPPHSETHTIQTSQAAGHHVPPTSTQDNHGFTQFHQNPVTSTFAAVTGSNRNGYNSGGAGAGESTVMYIHSAESIKALEDENFMLKRRIEELKTSNEFLLNQNAQLRLNSSLSVSRTSVGVENAVQVQPAVGVASVASGVVQTMVSMAQPMGITPSLVSVAATQPLSTISTLPTVSMPAVSISQALPVVSIAHNQPQPQTAVYPMVTTQGVLPQPQNLS